MARSEIDLVILHPETGEYVENAEIDIELRPAGTAATVYAAETGGSTNSQPLLSDEQGRVQGWLDRGRYQAVITVSGFPVTTEYFDIAPGADGAIATTWIADSAITTGKLNDGAVTSAKITDGTIATGDIADSAITTGKIAGSAVDSTKLAADSVTSSILKDDTSTDSNRAVTTDHIRDNAVTSAKIPSNAITTAKIADDNITTAKITDDSITSDKVNLTTYTANTAGQVTVNGSSSNQFLPGASVSVAAGKYYVTAQVETSHDSSNVSAMQFVLAHWNGSTYSFFSSYANPKANVPSGGTTILVSALTGTFSSSSVIVGIYYTGNSTGGTAVTTTTNCNLTAVRIS